MNFILKGITQSETLDYFKNISFKTCDLSQFSFDLRPRSFNFVQIDKITQFLEENSLLTNMSLLFENEVSLNVTELFKKCQIKARDRQDLILEFSGNETLISLEEYKLEYIWHYHLGEKIKNLSDCRYLKRIVFKQTLLDDFNQRGELHSFLGLFKELDPSVRFELQVDWDSEIILSLFDFFEFSFLSFEINRKVEVSYQRPDHLLIEKNLKQIDKLF